MDADLFFILLTVTGTLGAASAVALRKWERACAAVSFGAAALSALFGTIVAIIYHRSSK